MATVVESSFEGRTEAGAGVKAGNRFYFKMAVASFVVAAVGFAPTFWVPLVQGRLALGPIVYLHAGLFYAWTLLFMRQTWLAATGRTARHRELGIAGAALASAMLFVGLGAAIHAMRKADAAGLGPEGRSFSILAVSTVLLFAVLTAAALANVRKPEVHKRLLLVGMGVMLAPAVARWFIFFLAPAEMAPQGGLARPGQVSLSFIPVLLANSIFFAGMIRDRRVLGRVHTTYWIAGGLALAVEFLRVPFSETTAWLRVTDWLVALAP